MLISCSGQCASGSGLRGLAAEAARTLARGTADRAGTSLASMRVMRYHLLAFVLAACASPPPQPAGQVEHDMRNCPSALAGAETRLTNTADGVDLEITASEPAIQRQIVDLARLHERMGLPNASELEHTGRHGGPGTIGHCPIIHTGTTVTFDRVARGAVIHVVAMAPDEVLRLQTTVADRVARLATR